LGGAASGIFAQRLFPRLSRERSPVKNKFIPDQRFAENQLEDFEMQRLYAACVNCERETIKDKATPHRMRDCGSW